MSHMEIIPLYKSILESAGLDVDKDGLVSMDLSGELYPAECQGKRLAIPSAERLRSGEWQGLQAFHPLAENIYRGESPVLKKLRGLINYRIGSVLSCLMTELIEIAADTDSHKKLSPTQSEYLTLAPAADEKTVKDFNKVMKKNSNTGEFRLTSIYLKRGGIYKGEKYSRLAVASFPITDNFGNKDHTIFGVKVRAKDQRTFESLFEFILPGASDVETYSHGSNSMTAPFLHSLLKSFAKIARQLNKITHKFRKHLEDADGLHINLDWEDSLEDLSKYRDLIPTLSGNDGEPLKSDGTEDPHAKTKAMLSDPGTAPAPVVPQAPAAPQPTGPSHTLEQAQAVPPQRTQVEQPPQQTTPAVRSWDEIMRQQQQPQQPPMPQWNQPQQPHATQWGQQPQQPAWAQPQQPQQQASPREMGYRTNWNSQPMNPVMQPGQWGAQPQQMPQQQWGQQQMQPQVDQWGRPLQQGGPMYPGGI